MSYRILEGGTAGLVRFASPQEAQTVISVMNGKLLPGATSPLVIRPAEKKQPVGGKGNFGKGTAETVPPRPGPYAPNTTQFAPQQGQPSGGKGAGVSGVGLVKALMTQNVLPDGSKPENDCFVIYVCGLPLDMDE